HAAMALCNLSVHDVNQRHIIQQGGLPGLLRLLADIQESADCARYAGMAVCNLAAHRLNRVVIVEHGAVPHLVVMAQTERLENRRAALLALYDVSCAAANHIALIRANVMPALLNTADQNELDCKRYSIMT